MRSIAIALFLIAPLARAEIVAKDFEYKDHLDAQVTLQGHLAYDDAIKGKRPGVLIVHQWTGIGDHEKNVAKELAKLGYVAFAVDIYGKGVRPKDPASAGKEAGKYRKDRKLFRHRMLIAMAELVKTKMVADGKIAAIGYCFGGGGVLELARSGAPVAGVVSFHGNLDTPNPDDAKKIKGKVLVCHGADDPFVPDAQVAAFMKEMRAAKVDWQFNAYGGAVHSFTQPSAKMKGKPEYHEKAAKRAWKAMKDFLRECFA
ncbi:MAG: dienelactone hydrolase family protein [Planctomycetota bacterium]|jgi:dienelactone hydrolase